MEPWTAPPPGYSVAPNAPLPPNLPFGWRMAILALAFDSEPEPGAREREIRGIYRILGVRPGSPIPPSKLSTYWQAAESLRIPARVVRRILRHFPAPRAVDPRAAARTLDERIAADLRALTRRLG